MRRYSIRYFTVLLLALGLFLLTQTWASLIFLCAAMLLPMISLALCVRTLRAIQVRLDVPRAVSCGQAAAVRIHVTGGAHAPIWTARMRQSHSFFKVRSTLRPDEPLPTAHCGTVRIALRGVYVCDGMGLFRLRVYAPALLRVTVRPVPKAPRVLPELRLSESVGQKAAHGGVAESHELRAYRPGDELRRIHWKLSAKTGTLILREPILPVQRQLLLRTELAGTPAQLDDRLARLLWLSGYLLEKGHAHSWQVLTGNGITEFFVENEEAMYAALDALLDCAPARGGSVLDVQANAPQWYYIGGDGDEAP